MACFAVVLTRRVEPPPPTPVDPILVPKDDGRAARELAEARAQVARLDAQQRQEAERHRADMERLRAEQEGKDATQKAAASLPLVRSKVAAMDKLNRELRMVIAKYDEDMMLLFADRDVDPRTSTIAEVKGFFDQRQKLVEKSSGQMVKMLGEAREVAAPALDPRTPKVTRDEVAGELAKGEALAKNPYPHPLATYANAVAAVRTARDVARQQRVEKSKKAAAAFERYERSLPATTDVGLSRLDLFRAMKLMVDLRALHTTGKLTEKSARETLAAAPIGNGGYEARFVQCLREVITLAGDLRPEHNPETPSLRETFEVFSRLVNYEDIEAELLARPRIRR